MIIKLYDTLLSLNLLNDYSIFEKVMTKIQNKEKSMLKYEHLSQGRKTYQQKRSNSQTCARSIEYINNIDRVTSSMFKKRTWSTKYHVNEIFFDTDKQCMQCRSGLSLDYVTYY